ncbi:riboflavin kinase [Candidatus Nomurabacteria bacterium]|nr:riboflavin kinase [Candidatus Nomurabacteria bacterium]
MLFNSSHIQGIGRGKGIGFPTLNLSIPKDLILDDGIYSAWIVIDNKAYKGALHYGPIPTFNDKNKTMEVHLIDITDETFPDTNGKIIEVDIVDRIRDIKRFIETDDLTDQIDSDVEKIRKMLK